MRIFVTGTGVISCIGNGVNENFNSLVSSRHGITSLSEELDAFLPGFPIGRIQLTNQQLSEISGGNAKWPRAALLSLMASKEALSVLKQKNKLRLGFISATTVGGMDLTENGYANWQKSGIFNSRDFINHECGRTTELVADLLGINGFVTTINTACSSSANAMMMASRLIKQGIIDVAIAGGTDALTRFTLNGFNTLLILDQQHCRPFDASRAGLNLGEGAGYLLLAGEHMADQFGMEPICELKAYCNANDAYHQTASSPEGAGSFLAMSQTLEIGGIKPGKIDYINLHGTGTSNNDASEATAISQLFRESIPAHSSTKSYTGHTLGASGGIEAVYSTLAIQRNAMFPNLRFETAMSEIGVSPVTTFQHKEITNVLSNSFGFGGNCSSLLFSKV